MFDSDHRNKVACFMIGLAAFWFVCQKSLLAESDSHPPRILVVVTDPFDAELVKRIGREYVQVESLFALDAGAHPSNYDACNERVLGLLGFRLFVFRNDCPNADFWRERMVKANPHAKVHRMFRPRSDGVAVWHSGAQQASNIHSALVSILPEHRELLDENLKVELDRLRLRQPCVRQFISAEIVPAQLTEMSRFSSSSRDAR